MAQLPLIYAPHLDNIVRQELQKKPDLKDAYKLLEKSIVKNPKQASIEDFILNNGRVVRCYKKTAYAVSFSRSMPYSKNEIIILYEILDTEIRVVNVLFP